MPRVNSRKLPSPEKRLRDARVIANAAVNEAVTIASDVRISRSTRTRSAYKIKADALDRVVRVLAGKSVE